MKERLGICILIYRVHISTAHSERINRQNSAGCHIGRIGTAVCKTANASIGQTVFLAYYRSDLFHALLPLDDIIIWIRNFLVCIGLGIAAAAFPYRQREGKFGSEIVVLVCLSLVWFVSGLGNYQLDVLLLSGFIITAMEAIYHVFSTEEDVL